MSYQILLVEDDESLQEIISFNLSLSDYQVTTATTIAEAEVCIDKKAFDLYLFDVMVPGGCGLQLCHKTRARFPDGNIIMLTSLADEQDKISGLEMGADDYLTKPFSLRELQARIKARLRRTEPSCQAVRVGELTINTDRHEVTAAGQVIALTVKEFDLLLHLARTPGQVFSREQLLKSVWGYHFEGYEHTVNTHINRLRRKLKPFDYLHTVWGVGYKLSGGR